MTSAWRLSLHGQSPADAYIWRTYLIEQWHGFLWGAPGQAAGLGCLVWLVQQWPASTIAWAAPLTVMAVLWLVVAVLARRVAADPGQATAHYTRWRVLLLASAAAQSAVWGALAYGLLPAAPEAWQPVLVISVLMYAYTAMVFAIHDFAMTLAGVLPSLCPMLARLALENATPNLYLIGVVLFSLVTCLAVGRVIGAKLLEADRLRADKLVLAEQLQFEIARANEARERAERADRQKSEFFAAASHDLRQPLHALMLLTGHLRERPLPPEALDVVGRIGQALGALSLMFEKMFDVARIDAHKVDNHPRPFGLHALFDTLDNEFGVLCAEKGLRWRLQPTRDWAHADPLLVERVLRNFLNNAVRYTAAGGDVLLRARRRGDHVVCQVWDSGCGVARAHRQRIFDDYFQADNPARHLSEGLGLGLGVVRRLCALADWPVSVRSRCGRGSCFSVALPWLPPEADTPPPSRSASPPASDGRAPLVMLVDDDPDVLRATEAALGTLGWQLVVGPDADYVLQAVAQGDALPAALLCDLRLGTDAQGQKLDGLSVIARLRHEFGLDLPAMLLTADIDSALLQQAATLRITVLRKPVDARRLHEALRAVLEKKMPA